MGTSKWRQLLLRIPGFRRLRIDAWRRAAKTLELEHSGRAHELHGTLGEVYVHARPGFAAGRRLELRVSLDGAGRIPANINLIGPKEDASGVPIPGKESLRIRGDSDVVLAMFDLRPDFTKALETLLIGMEVRDGWIHKQSPGWITKERIVREVLHVVRVADMLWMEKTDVSIALVRAMARHPDPSIRARAVTAVGLTFPQDQYSLDALDAAHSDDSLQVRFAAARFAADPVGAARTILSDLRRTDLSDPENQRILDNVLDFLIKRLPADRLTTILRQELQCPLEDIRHKAIEVLVPMAGADAEPDLIGLLDDESRLVRWAALRGLARVGSKDAVEPLLRFSKRVLLDLDVKRLTDVAIERIQSRIRGAANGQLSIVIDDDLGGAVSEAEDAGALSMAREGVLDELA